MSRDPHEVLGVERGAGPDEIKAAYRKLAKQYHPDVNPEGEDRFKEINAAYDALTNPKPETHQPGWDQHYDVHDIFRAQFEELFRRHHQRRRANSDVHVQIEISLKQAFDGCEAEVKVHAAPGQPTHKLDLPRGVQHGQRLCVVGAGMREDESQPPGNLFVTVFVRPHERFERHGDALVTVVEVDALEAVVGSTVEVETIDGLTLGVTIPPGTQYGTRLRAQGYGMVRDGHRGDLIITVLVRTPTVLNEKHVQLVERLKEILPKTGSGT